jgi:hypothetical protein
MAKFNLDMNDSYNQVKMHRQIIGPKIIFMSQLMLGPMIRCSSPMIDQCPAHKHPQELGKAPKITRLSLVTGSNS